MENQKIGKELIISKTKTRYVYAFFKRVMDLVCCVPGTILFLIAYIVLAFFYNFGSNKGEILYKQKRIGQNGEMFTIYKFRSMITNAEEVLVQNKLLYKKYVKNNHKLEPDEDPRITNLGKFIRKTSIDELPQFLNVLKGDMSMVGPRPIVRTELEEYGEKKELFLLMKPGIAGVWQANGRSEIGYPERCDLELSYLELSSIKNDILIIIRTVLNVFLKKGAY